MNNYQQALTTLKDEVNNLSYAPHLTGAGKVISHVYDPILAEPLKVFGLRVGKAYLDLQTFESKLQSKNDNKDVRERLSLILKPIRETNPAQFPDKQTKFGTPVCTQEDIGHLANAILSTHEYIEELKEQKKKSIPEAVYECLEILEDTQLQWENGIAVHDNRVKLLNGLGGSWIFGGVAGIAAGAVLPIDYALMTTFAAAAAATTWSVVSFANMPKDALAMAMRVTDKMWSAVNYGFCFSQMYATTAVLKYGGGKTLESISYALETPSLGNIFEAAVSGLVSTAAAIVTPIVLHKVFEGMVQSSLMYDFCDLARSGANIVIEQSAKASMGFSRNNMRMQEVLSHIVETSPRPSREL